MPTATPSMTTPFSANTSKVVKKLAPPRMPSAMTAPAKPTRIGSPAARIEPNVRNSTSSASGNPTASASSRPFSSECSRSTKNGLSP